MTRARRVLRVLAAMWVCCQAIGLAAAPTVLCLRASLESAAECTCARGDHGMCPMHHSTPAKPRSKSDCSCRGSADPAAAVLATIVGPIAVVPERFSFETDRSATALDRHTTPHTQSSFLTPDGPPPRF